MAQTELLKITQKDAGRLKLARTLSIIFVALNITLTLGGWPISISSIIIVVILSRISPRTDAELNDDPEREAKDFKKWLDAHPSRKYMNKSEQLTAFKYRDGRS